MIKDCIIYKQTKDFLVCISFVETNIVIYPNKGHLKHVSLGFKNNRYNSLKIKKLLVRSKETNISGRF